LISIGVAATDAGSEAEARTLAEKLDLPLLPTGISPQTLEDPRAILFAAPAGLHLQQTGRGAPGPVTVQFASAAMRHRRRARQNELLGRAVGVGKKPRLEILDATAGLGRDSFVLADLGCRITLCERQPIIAELLASGLARARASGDDWLRGAASRMKLLPGDARQLNPSSLQAFDVVYLDPMFPARTKSANVKKEMALLQDILDSDDSVSDSDDLLLWSLVQDVARVVVKRPAKAPVLAARKPSHVISGRAIRYDVYVTGSLV
jgi:16S rRNA (guanine1516-N2)-methyltransferase